MSIFDGIGRIFYYLFLYIMYGFSSFTSDESDLFDYEKIYRLQTELEIAEPERPAITGARLVGETDGYGITNAYSYDYYSKDLVYMLGVPIEIESRVTEIEGEDLSLVFAYDESKLKCDENSLGVLWYDGNGYDNNNLLYCDADYDKNELTVKVQNMGTYILIDKEIWWGLLNGTYVQDWRDQFAYEDIEALADTTIYDGSGEYHITTVEQLAGLVKLVNEGNDFTGSDFYLDSDLDLEGYEWAPIGWYYPADKGYLGQDFPFNGRFFGNGHVIYNMTIVNTNQSDLGMFGRTLQGFEIHDLALIDCYIEGKYYVGGILGDNINSGDEFDMTNCVVTGTVKGSLSVGALVGSSARMHLKDCYAIMEEEGTTVLTGDLRGGFEENCSMNDDAARKAVEQFLKAGE